MRACRRRGKLAPCKRSGLWLAAGEAVATEIGEEPLSVEEKELVGSGWNGGTPLWLYVLLESAARGEGERLGPVGGRRWAEPRTLLGPQPLLEGRAGEAGDRAGEEGAGGPEVFRVVAVLGHLDIELLAVAGDE
jgi:hypothetical protein